MRGKGLAHITVGEGQGENRVSQAIKKAMESPLLDTTIDGATDLIVSICGEVSLMDVDAAMKEMEPKISTEANIIFGAREDANLKDAVTVTLIATGIRDTVNVYPSYRPSMNYNYGTQYSRPIAPVYNQEPVNSQPAPQSQIDESPSSFFFSPKKKQKQEEREAVGPSGESASIDSLNVDLSKIGFNKNPNGSKDLLPSFITNNDKK